MLSGLLVASAQVHVSPAITTMWTVALQQFHGYKLSVADVSDACCANMRITAVSKTDLALHLNSSDLQLGVFGIQIHAPQYC